MRKTLSLLFVAVLFASTFTSCKRGENDPAISLLSRTARLSGEWELSASSETTTSGSYSSTETFNGTILTYSSNGSTSTSTYTESLTIVKDGTYESSSTEIDSNGTEMSTIKGSWSWIDGNKEDEYKNQERVLFTVSSYMETGSGYTDTGSFDGDNDGSVMRISRLASKEMVISEKYTRTSGSTLYTVTAEKTYIQK